MPFDDFDKDKYRAEKLQTAFRRFVRAFLEEDAGPVCGKLLENESMTFRGGNVGQKPEEFTQKALVDEVLDALGYKPKHHPVDLMKDEQRQPDIHLRNLSEQYVGIVECKALNRERSGEEAIDDLVERNLQANTFAKYKKHPKMRYLVGIATDGFDWKLRVKDLETNELLPDFSDSYSLVDDSKGIYHCYYTEVHKETKTDWPAIRDELAQNFVSTFGIHNLPGN